MTVMTDVRQNESLSRFELDVEGQIAFTRYRMADGVMLLPYSETPLSLRGRGIGERVVLGALEIVRAKGLKVRPLCGFVRSVIAAHPEHHDLLA